MNDDNRQFENFVRGIKFDDIPAPNHRDRLEQDLLRALAKQAPRQIEIWRMIMKSRITKLAAAAVIIIAVLIGIHHFKGSVNLATPAFAKMIQEMKKMPWMHVVTQIKGVPSHENGEYWYSFDLGIEAIRYDSGKLRFFHYGQQIGYVYDPTAKEVTISRLPESRLLLGAESPWEFLEKTVEILTKNVGAEVTRQVGQYDGMNVEIYQVRVPRGIPKGSLGTEQYRFIADSTSHLLLTWELERYDPNGNFTTIGKVRFDYPDDGPADIYELGAPRSAAVIDDRTKPEVEEILKTYKAYCQNAPSRYIAVAVHYNHIERIGADVIDEVVRVYTDGRLQRFEKYQVFDWLEYVDNWPKYSAQMGNTLDSQLKWWTQGEYSGCILVVLYDGEYNYTVNRDLKTKRWSSQPPEHDPERNYRDFGVSSWGWPQYNLRIGVPGEPPITVLEDDYSKQKKLICLQMLWQGKVHKDWAALPFKKLWYLNPQRDYICQRFEERYVRNAPWQKDKSWLEGVEPDRISAERTRIREVTEFGQTDAGQWYPKRIEAGRNALAIFLDTDPEFPEGIFDSRTLPKADK